MIKFMCIYVNEMTLELKVTRHIFNSEKTFPSNKE